MTPVALTLRPKTKQEQDDRIWASICEFHGLTYDQLVQQHKGILEAVDPGRRP